MSSHRRDRPTAGGDRRSAHRDEETTTTRRLGDYFIRGDGLNREVLQSEICRFLGNEATLRVATHEGMQGYMVKAYRPFTPEMLKDLKEMSASFEAEKAKGRQRGGREALEYGQSQTSERRHFEAEPPYGNSNYGPSPVYGNEQYAPPPGYGPPSAHPSYPPNPYDSGLPGNVGYPQGYPLGSGQPGAPPTVESQSIYQPNTPRNPGGQAQYPYAHGPSGAPGYMPPGPGYEGAYNMHGDQAGANYYQPDQRGQSSQRGRNAMPGSLGPPVAEPSYGQNSPYGRSNPNPYEQPSRGGYSSGRQDAYPSRGGGGRR